VLLVTVSAVVLAACQHAFGRAGATGILVPNIKVPAEP
jgi:hypothetical protein